MNARWNRLRLCAMALLVAPVTLLSGETLVKIDPLLPVPAGKDANDPNRFSVSGVVFMTGTPVALVTDTIRSRSWFVWGDSPVDRYNIREITREQVILVERGSGRELRLPVGTSAAGGPAAAGPAPFTKEWINSKANPMFGHPVSPPVELYTNWPTATNADKAEISDFYEKYGWKLARAEIIAGAADFAWEWLYEHERIAAAKAKRESFLNLLSPEQKQIWQQISSGQSIYAVEGKYTDEQQKLIAERRKQFADFQSSFTAEQKAAFETMSRSSSGRTPPRPADPEFVLPRPAPGDPEAAPYTKARINSEANPMLHRVDESELTRRWSGLTDAQRRQLVEFYQQHGWQLIYVESVSGFPGSMAWRNIYENDRIAILKAKREAFLGLLSPEQRHAWKTGPTSQTVFIKDGKPDYAKNRNRDEQQRFFDQFWSTLNAEQKAAYEGKNDFTKADWK